ncbi:aldehyde dehydrogenase family protein [Pseudomonas sp. NPDC088444]|uniref:aldehyde dehydrogenase family protein n=1 Tax=Pseudomonas sp. NPDC088444 TaxID=3364456 RepID=UPI00384DFEEA
MWNVDQAYIDGAFAQVHGTERVPVINPASEQIIGHVTLANRADATRAIEAAMRAQGTLASFSKAQRIEMLNALQQAVLSNSDQIRDSAIEEYGGVFARTQWVSQYAAQCFENSARLLERYEFVKKIGDASVIMEPIGVAALIAPWNSVAGTVCSKLASAIAAGCTSVIKPSELSPLQTQVLANALHQAGLPSGVYNILLGRGHEVGDELTRHPGISKISFTGSTSTGKNIARASVDTMKRVSLALSGKSAMVLLADADLATAIPLALNAAFMNNGQACVAGSRLLVPRARLDEVVRCVQACVKTMRVGDPRNPATVIGPAVSLVHYERVQGFIRRGLEQGATLVAGGEGRPEGLKRGYFVRPTVFANVSEDMDIAREEIFGPVLCIMAYDSLDQAIAMANRSDYGLQAYVFSNDLDMAQQVASRLEVGTVLVNRCTTELLAPFGGRKQSGVGREFGLSGMESFLEPKTVLAS